MIHSTFHSAFRSPRSTFRSSWPVFLPFLVYVLHAQLFSSWIIDDAGISFAYARNFIHGHGLVAQTGVEPVEGFSNPLWTLLISPLFIADPGNPTVAIKLLSCCLILGAYAIVGRINRRCFGETWWSRAATASGLLFVSGNTSFVVWTTSGLENPLYALLCSVLCLVSIRYATDGRDGDAFRRPALLPVAAGMSAAGLALTRPDGLIFLAAFPAVLAIRAANGTSAWKMEGRRLLLFLAAALVPLAAYAAFRVTYFGDIAPNTFHVKGGPSPRDVVNLFLLTQHYIDKIYDLFQGMVSLRAGPLLVLLMLGVAHSIARRGKSSPVVFLLPIAACAWIAYALLPIDWMGEYRFATPLFLLLPLLLFALLADILLSSPFAPRTRGAVFLTGAVLLLAQSAIVHVPRSLRFAASPVVPFESVAETMGMRFNMYADTLGISGATLLTPDLGGALYFSRHRIHDLSGHCDREFAQLINAADTAALRDHIFHLRPTFIHVHDYWSMRTGLFGDGRFRELYAAIAESPSRWAEERGYDGVCSGDYVLKEAIPAPESLERLRNAFGDGARSRNTHGKRTARPFPRG